MNKSSWLRRVWVGFVFAVIALVTVLSLADLFGLEAWAWFDSLGFGAIPKGLGLIAICAIGGLAYLMDKKRDE